MSEPDTADLARRVMEAAEKATEGPWTYADSAPASFGTAWVNSPDVHNLAACDGTRRSPTHGFSLVMKDGENEANAAFIALSRTAAPALAQDHLADRAEIERLREALRGLVDRDLTYNGPCIVIPMTNHGAAIEAVRQARTALKDKTPEQEAV